MSISDKKFNDHIRALRSENVLIILDIENITTKLLDIIYNLLERCELKISIAYDDKLYNILNIYNLLKVAIDISSNGKTLSILRTLEFVKKQVFENESYMIDSNYEVIIITDNKSIANNPEDVGKYKLILNTINLTIKDRKQQIENVANAKISFKCILFNVPENETFLQSYTNIYDGYDLFSISRNDSFMKSLKILQNTINILISNTIFTQSVITKDVELSFAQSPEMKLGCDLYSLATMNLNVGSNNYKTKMFETDDPQQKEIVNVKVVTDFQTSEVIPPSTIKPCLELYDDTLIPEDKVKNIFENQIILGKNEDVTYHPFISAQGFVPIASLAKTFFLANLGKPIELIPSDNKYENSIKFLNNLKETLFEKDLAILCLAKLTRNKGVRNYAIVPRKITNIDDSLTQKDVIKLIIIDIPFKDEIRMYPKINIHEDYKISEREKDQYMDFKTAFRSIYASGDLNLANDLTIDPIAKLDQILSSCDIDLQTKRYNIVLKDAITNSKILTEEEEMAKQDVEELDPTFEVVKKSTKILLENHVVEIEILNEIKDVYNKQFEYVQERNIKKNKTSNKRTQITYDDNGNEIVLNDETNAEKRQKI